jgi:adenosine/AMP kinase
VRAAEPWPPVIINDPYKVILVNVNPIATIEDITQAVKHLVPETTISIKNVELVEQHRKGFGS